MSATLITSVEFTTANFRKVIPREVFMNKLAEKREEAAQRIMIVNIANSFAQYQRTTTVLVDAMSLYTTILIEIERQTRALLKEQKKVTDMFFPSCMLFFFSFAYFPAIKPESKRPMLYVVKAA